MVKKKLDSAAESKKDKALEESFAEIKKAAEADKLEAKPEEASKTKRAAAAKMAKSVAKTATKRTAAAKTAKTEPKLSVTLEFNGKQIDVEEVRKQVLKAARKAKSTAKKIDVYVVANQSAAYYVVDGEGKDEYRIGL